MSKSICRRLEIQKKEKELSGEEAYWELDRLANKTYDGIGCDKQVYDELIKFHQKYGTKIALFLRELEQKGISLEKFMSSRKEN